MIELRNSETKDRETFSRLGCESWYRDLFVSHSFDLYTSAAGVAAPFALQESSLKKWSLTPDAMHFVDHMST